MADIAVVDYGMGNLRSVAKALRFVAPRCTTVVSSDPATIRNAARVVLPGQSAMPDCMRSLDASGLREGSDVRLAGVKIGKVDRVRLLSPSEVGTGPNPQKIEAFMNGTLSWSAA